MKRVKVADLVPGMVTAEDVLNYSGQMILPKGLVLTDNAITKLDFYSILTVCIDDEASEVTTESAKENSTPIIAPENKLIRPSHYEEVQASPEFQKFRAAFDENIDAFKDSVNNIVTMNTPINTEELLGQSLSLLQYGNSMFSTFDMLHNMRQYDDLTFAHSMNVSLISNVFAGWLGWSAEDRELVTLCGLLHDIGKVKIPDAIIKKPDKLTDEEFAIVKTHPIEGYKILQKQAISPHVMNSALMHHEKCDGSGYPLKITGDKIDRFAKVVTIADIYDAMTSARIYRGPWCPYRVIELYESEGLQKYDAHMIMTFLEGVSNTYLHCNVLLSDGRIGRIVFINKQDLSRPIIQMEDNSIIDLSKQRDLTIKELV
ncbi:MAG: HD-GYP domain-containing protein [Lachnospiraceae bacterium]|nr:HD-GYP domain-containing protein [Lachnospiraceae bacterium]